VAQGSKIGVEATQWFER